MSMIENLEIQVIFWKWKCWRMSGKRRKDRICASVRSRDGGWSPDAHLSQACKSIGWNCYLCKAPKGQEIRDKG